MFDVGTISPTSGIRSQASPSFLKLQRFPPWRTCNYGTLLDSLIGDRIVAEIKDNATCK